MIGVLPWSQALALQSKTYFFNSDTEVSYDTSGPAVFSLENVQARWYDSQWNYRQIITVKKEYINGTTENATLPITITTPHAPIFKLAKDDGSDIVITDSDGVTNLNATITNYDKEHSLFSATVSLSQISDEEDTTLYLYYGNDQVTASPSLTVSSTLTDGLIGHWTFDDPSGSQVSDSSGNGHNGTIVNLAGQENDVQWSNSETAEKVVTSGVSSANPYSMYFPGAGGGAQNLTDDNKNPHINIGSNASLAPGDALTVSLWARPLVQQHQYLVGKGYDCCGRGGSYSLLIQSDNLLRGFIWSTNGGKKTVTSTVPVNLDEWTHIAFTFDGSSLNIYQDGVLTGSQDIGEGTITPNGNPLNLGSLGITEFYNYVYYHYAGYMDDVRIYSRALDVGEIQDLAIPTLYKHEDTNSLSSVQATESLHSTSVPATLARDGITATVTLKKEHPLTFSMLSSFKPNTGGTVTYQLSNDAGKTWYFYTKNGWKTANPQNANHTISANDINGHLDTFPTGSGQLIWSAYLTESATLDSIAIDYQPGTEIPGGSFSATAPTSLSDPRIKAINSLFNQVSGRHPTFDEWLFWANRMISGEKTTIQELFGALQYANIFGNQ